MKVLALPGDGIGPEVVSAALRVLRWAAPEVQVEVAPMGGASLDAFGVPVHEDVLAQACAADAVLLGAVGGPKWDHVPTALRPERGLLALRKAMGVYANLRPARCFVGVEGPLRPEVAAQVDLVVVRELIGGIYFGDHEETADAGRDVMAYGRDEIRRVGQVAFELARSRSGRLMSVDKANVLASSRVWRDEMTRLAADYPDVTLTHTYVDAAAMRLVTTPRDLDVVVTGNLFGDILSDAAAALTGSLGMLPSAATGPGAALYEPVHGSAPDIAGQGIANPMATLLSVAMMLRWSLGKPQAALQIEAAVERVVREGILTPDLGGYATTDAVTDAVLRRLRRQEAA